MGKIRRGISRAWKTAAAAVAFGVLLAGCMTEERRPSPEIRHPDPSSGVWARVKTTGYCKCGSCCSWHRNLLGHPVISAGPNRGKPKAVGVTASGTRARPGVIAADTNIFAFGTVMYIPGYGYGRVEDVGGAIKGYHLDLYFTSHETARKWGVRTKEIRFWRPAGSRPTPGYRYVNYVPTAVRPRWEK
jgi:3D (Asp-Asp-Asp) domain-containing protein